MGGGRSSKIVVSHPDERETALEEWPRETRGEVSFTHSVPVDHLGKGLSVWRLHGQDRERSVGLGTIPEDLLAPTDGETGEPSEGCPQSWLSARERGGRWSRTSGRG